MLLSPELLCLLGLMALGTVHASPSAKIHNETLALDTVHNDSLPTAEVYPGCAEHCPMLWLCFNGRCYKYVPTPMTWNDAEKNCLSEGARLASIHSVEEHNFVLKLIQASQTLLGRETWIGLNDLYVEGEWMWSDCSDVNYTPWYIEQPSGGGDCVVTCGGYLKWCDFGCGNAAPSVCVRRP